MKKISFLAVCAVMAALAVSGSLSAHHGDAGRYIEEIVEVTGVVVETQLINPHSILVFDVTDADGATVRWQAEMGGAQAFIRNGLDHQSAARHEGHARGPASEERRPVHEHDGASETRPDRHR